MYIGSTPPDLPAARRAIRVDPFKHHYNFLAELPRLDEEAQYKLAVNVTAAIGDCFTNGLGTLTRETGLEMILDTILARPKSFISMIPLPSKSDPLGHHWAYGKVRRLMLSPVLRDLLDPTKNSVKISDDRTILVSIDRGRLMDLDARFITRMFMAVYNGQLVLDNYGPYALPSDIDLLYQNRLIISVKELKLLPENMRDQVLYLSDTTTSGVSYKDAVRLAEVAGYSPDPLREANDYNNTIRTAMQG